MCSGASGRRAQRHRTGGSLGKVAKCLCVYVCSFAHDCAITCARVRACSCASSVPAALRKAPHSRLRSLVTLVNAAVLGLVASALRLAHRRAVVLARGVMSASSSQAPGQAEQSAPAPGDAPGVGGQSALARLRQRALSAEVAVASEETPSKRFRRMSSFLEGASPAGNVPTGSSRGDDDEEETKQEIDIGKTCMSCMRQFGYDCSYLMPGEAFAWLYPDGRGSQCRDCGNLYRIAYKATMTSSLFERWLKEPSNRLAWSRLLVAYLSLKRDGMSHVSMSTLKAREAMLAYVFDLLQLPFPGAMVVAPDAAFLQLMATESEPRRYLALAADGSAQGSAPRPVPLQPAVAGLRFVAPLHGKQVWPLVPLATLPDGLREQWVARFGSGSGALANASQAASSAANDAPAPPPEVEQLSVQELSFNRKVDHLQDSLRILVASLVGVGGAQCKEREFSPLITKVLKLKQDVLQTSLGGLIAKLEATASIATAAKKMVRPMREYLKCGRRNLLDAMHENLVVVRKYAHEQGLAMTGDFSSIFAKARFFHLQLTSTGDALDFLRGYTYPPETLSLTIDNISSPASIIHHCMSMQAYEALRMPAAESGDEAWSLQKDEFFDRAELYKSFSTSLVGHIKDAEVIAEVFGALFTLAAAACSKPFVVPKEVTKAKTLIATHTLAVQLKEGLASSGMGACLATDADAVVLRGALDDSADAEFLLLAQDLFSAGMPSFDQDSNKITVDAKLVDIDGKNCPLASSLSESIRALVAIIKSWSPAHLAEEADSVQGLIQQFVHCLVVFDTRRMREAARTWKELRAQWARALDNPDGLLAGDGDDEAAMRVQADESCMDMLATLIPSLELVIQQHAQFIPEVKKVTEDLRLEYSHHADNRKIRSSYWAECASMKMVLESRRPPSPELIDDFVHGKPNMLSYMVSIADGRAQLIRFECSSPDIEVVFVGDEAEDDSEGEFDHWAEFMREDETNLAARMISAFVVPAIEVASAHFVRLLPTSRAMVGTMGVGEWASQEPIFDIVAKFFGGREAFQDSVGRVRSLIARPLAEAAEDPVMALWSLLSSFSVGLSKTSLKKLLSALAKNSIFVPNFVKPGTEMPLKTVALMVDSMAFIEEGLMLVSVVVDFFERMEINAGKHERVDGRELALIGEMLKFCGTFGERFRAGTSVIRGSFGVENLSVSLADLSNLAEHIEKYFQPRFIGVAKAICLKSLESPTNKLLADLPRFDHIVTGSSYNKTLAKKQLLQNPIRATLGDLISSVGMYRETIISFVDETFASGGEGDSATAATSPEAVACDAALELGNQTMTVIAAVNAEQEFRGSAKGRDMAVALLAKASALIPASLRRELEVMASG